MLTLVRRHHGQIRPVRATRVWAIDVNRCVHATAFPTIAVRGWATAVRVVIVLVVVVFGRAGLDTIGSVSPGFFTGGICCTAKSVVLASSARLLLLSGCLLRLAVVFHLCRLKHVDRCFCALRRYGRGSVGFRSSGCSVRAFVLALIFGWHRRLLGPVRLCHRLGDVFFCVPPEPLDATPRVTQR